MKPVQRLRSEPPFFVIAHEVGHLVIGLELELHEGGIEFITTECDELARAHYNQTRATTKSQILRSIAGMYFQALITPDSISDDLRRSILNGPLFRERVNWIRSRVVPEDIVNNGFRGDWVSVVSLTSTGSSRTTIEFQVLDELLTQLRAMVYRRCLKPTAEALIADVQSWLVTEDDDIRFSPMIIYPISRAWSILRSETAKHRSIEPTVAGESDTASDTVLKV